MNTQAGWSREVTETSHALDLEEGVFTWDDPKKIARSLKKSAQASKGRKADPFRSAMSMLNFYINRAGDKLPAGSPPPGARRLKRPRTSCGPFSTTPARVSAKRHAPL